MVCVLVFLDGSLFETHIRIMGCADVRCFAQLSLLAFQAPPLLALQAGYSRVFRQSSGYSRALRPIVAASSCRLLSTPARPVAGVSPHFSRLAESSPLVALHGSLAQGAHGALVFLGSLGYGAG